MQSEQELSVVALHWSERVVPAGHGTHVLQTVVPSDEVNVPFGQGVLDVEPALDVYVPIPHNKHAALLLEADMELYVPAEQS